MFFNALIVFLKKEVVSMSEQENGDDGVVVESDCAWYDD